MALDERVKNGLNACLILGDVHFDRGEYDLARLFYEMVLKTKPDCIEAIGGLNLSKLKEQGE